jgi:putative membrane protein
LSERKANREPIGRVAFFLFNFLKGIAIGIANAIPGVSGGTIAVILRVYDVLIESLSFHWKAIVQNLPLLISLGLGLVFGIFGFSKLLDDVLFANYSQVTYFGFIGLILGSIPLMLTISNIQRKDYKRSILPFLFGFILLLAISFWVPTTNHVVTTDLSFSLFVALLGSCAIAAIAMIIPGISGSFVLLALGQYETVIQAVSDMNIRMLLPVAIGIVVGLLFGARMIHYFLTHHRTPTYAVILGLLIASIIVLWPGFPDFYLILPSIVTCLFGFLLALIFGQYTKKRSN